MFCSSCGKPVDDNDRFCGNCGAPLIRPRVEVEDPGLRSAGSDPAGSRSASGSEAWDNYEYSYTGTRSSEPGAAGFENGASDPEPEYQAKGFDPYAPGTPDRFIPGKQRSIALCIILSIVTCGIYMLYWMAMLNDEVNRAVEDDNAMSGVLVVLLSVVTCNVFAWYWLYKMGEKITWIEQRQGIGNNSNTSILYLILGVLALDIVPLALMQDTMNRL